MTALDSVKGTVCNATQYDLSQAFRHANHSYSGPSISCLTRGESIGLVLAAEASLISSISIIVIFIRIAWNVRWYRKRFPKGDWKLFQDPTDIYMFSLFVSDFLQAMGGILDVWWAHKGIVTSGPYCTAQGLIQQIGEVGVALITLLLAVHTFVVALWQVGLQARGFALGMVCLVWVFIALWVVIGMTVYKNDYDTPTPYWCWISYKVSRIRIGGEYIWLWIALLTTAILYPPLYFWTEGRLSVDKEKWYKFHMSGPQRVEYPQRRAALGMLLYPVAYSFVVLPTSISRWLQFKHPNVSSAATFFGVTMFNLSGAINVLLFLTVRPQLLLFSRSRKPADLDSEPDIELTLEHKSEPTPSHTSAEVPV